MEKQGLDPRWGWASEAVHFLGAAELLRLDKTALLCYLSQKLTPYRYC